MTTNKALDTLQRYLGDQEWRLNNLYWITDKSGKLVRFQLNHAQYALYKQMHTRNEILKARQLGMSTFIALLSLDCCLFNRHFKAGIIDKALTEATKKVDKVRMAYNMLDYLPPDATEKDKALAQIGAEIKACTPLVSDMATCLKWSNGSSLEGGASMRGSTLQLLHVSELAYVAAHAPLRAKEIVTGALEAIAQNCYVFKESTHEGGRAGLNYTMVQQAMANGSKAELAALDYKFFFFPWHTHPHYRMEAKYWDDEPDKADALGWMQRRQLVDYFSGLERFGIRLTSEQKAWYGAKFRTLGYTVRQEYPSTPDEAFDVLAERAVYGTELTFLKAQGKLGVEYEHEPLRPVYTSWDIGIRDLTCIWLVQISGGGRYKVLDYYAGQRMPFDHYVGIVRAWEERYRFRIVKNFVPHDAQHVDFRTVSYETMLQTAGLPVEVVKRTPSVSAAIEATKQILPYCDFHERCGEVRRLKDGTEVPSGLASLENYQWAPDKAGGTLAREPLHDIHSHGADAFRTFAQAVAAGMVSTHGQWVDESANDDRKLFMGDIFSERRAPGTRAVGANWL